MKNYDCEGTHCRDAHGEVRKLPSGGDANMILCHDCYDYEIAWRRDRNKELATWRSTMAASLKSDFAVYLKELMLGAGAKVFWPGIILLVLGFLIMHAQANLRLREACEDGVTRGPYAGRLSKADEQALIQACIEGRRFPQ